MRIKVPPSGQLGQWFTYFELELDKYPDEIPCCCKVGDIELIYVGDKQFRLLSISDNYSPASYIDSRILKKGTVIKQNDCSKITKEK